MRTFWIIAQFALITGFCYGQQGVSINPTGQPPHPSAALDIQSTQQGLLPPRLTTAQRDAIVAPAEGLMIFNTTTKCINYFANSVWNELCAPCNPQPTAPNAGPDQGSICGAVTLQANTPSQGTGSWSIVSGQPSNTYSLSNPALPNAVFTGQFGQTYTLRWSITTPCATLFDDVTITCGLPSTLSNGLQAYYPFCGNANDVSGNNRNGVVNGATLTSGRLNSTNNAYNFNGSNQWISTSYVPPTGTNSRTISAWIKTSAVSNTSAIVYGSFLPAGASFRVGVNGYGGCEGVTLNVSDGALTRGAVTADNNWHFYTWVVQQGDAIGSVLIYRDGVLLNSNCANTSSLNTIMVNTGSADAIRFGYNHYETAYFNGQLDDIAIWNRALNASEVLQLYTYLSTTP